MKYISLSLCFVAGLALTSCEDTNVKDTTTENSDTAVLLKENEVTEAEKQAINWNEVDFNSPIVKYDEIHSSDIEVRGNDKYSVYVLKEKILFETGKADIQPKTQSALAEVCSSLAAHNPNGNIKVYGNTDAVGTEEDNEVLSRQRAESVMNYLVSNCNITASNIITVGQGEENPVATNSTPQGRQLNRTVRIVAVN